MGGTDLCNPASHLEQDCLQYQVLSAVALAAQSLISAVGVHVPTFWVTCSSSGYPPSPVFSIISNLNLIIHSLWSLPANTKRSHHHNSHSNPVGRSLQNLASISLFYFFFFFLFRNHSFYSLALLLKEKGVPCGHDLPS